jgi:hypothetical protein
MWRPWLGFFLVLSIFLGIDHINYEKLQNGSQKINFTRPSWSNLDTAEFYKPGLLRYSGALSWWEHASLLSPICAALFGAWVGYLRYRKISTIRDLADMKEYMLAKKREADEGGKS